MAANVRLLAFLTAFLACVYARADIVLPLVVTSSPINVCVMPTRQTGTAPLGVTFATDCTTATGISKPFHNIQRTWNYGDDDTTLWLYGAHVGDGTALAKKNRGAGPVGAHLYETPGTYYPVVTFFDGTNTATQTLTITVSDPETTFATTTYCAANGSTPVPGAAGCPSGATASALNAGDFDAELTAALGANGCGLTNPCRRILFKRGDAFTASTTTSVNVAAAVTIGAYPVAQSATLPAITITGVAGAINVGASTTDLRIMDMEFVGSSADTDTSIPVNMAAGAANVTATRLYIHGTGKGFSVSSGAVIGPLIQENRIVDYWRTGGSGWFGGITRGAILGNLVGQVNELGEGEHGIRVQGINNILIANNTIEEVGHNGAGRHQITVRAQEHVGGVAPNPATDTRYFVVADNKLVPTTNNGASQIGATPSGGTQCQWGSDGIIERNWLAFGTGANARGFASEWVDITFRNNVIDGSAATTNAVRVFTVANLNDGTCSVSGDSPIPTPTRNTFYNNTYYSSASGTQFVFYIDGRDAGGAVTDTLIYNNLAYAPSVGANVTYLPYYIGTTTGLTHANNSTDLWHGGASDGTNQIELTTPNFTSVSPFTPANARTTVGSYAIDGGTSVPVWSDFFLVNWSPTWSIGAVHP